MQQPLQQPPQRSDDADAPSRSVVALHPAAHAQRGAPAADATLEVPLRLLGRTVKRTRQALAALQPGQVLALYTDDP